MNEAIHFNCPHCGTVYHSTTDKIGKHLKCSICNKVIEIKPFQEEEKKIDTPTGSPAKPPVQQQPEVITTQKTSSKVLIIPALALILIIVGSFFSVLFPMPQLVGACCLIWQLGRNSKRNWFKALAELAQSTMFGLLALLIILVILNFGYRQSSSSPPSWLIATDDLLIWSREHLKYLAEFSLATYLSIFALLLFVSIAKPDWHPVTRFLASKKIIERILAVLIVITSFTFFAPAKLESTVDSAYFKQFKLAVRKELQQERRALLAVAVRDQISKADTTGYAANLPFFASELNQVYTEYTNESVSGHPPDEEKIARAAVEDVTGVMSSYTETTQKDNLDNNTWRGSDDNLEKEWKQQKEVPHWQSNRRAYVAEAVKQAGKTEAAAAEAVEGAKEAFKKMMGAFVPESLGVAKMYIEETVNTLSEYVFEAVKAPQIVSRFFESLERIVRKADLFGKIAGFWSRNKKIPIIEVPPVASKPDNPSPYNTSPSLGSNSFDESKTETGEKICLSCGHVVSRDAHVGQMCPYCHKIWVAENP